MNIPDKEFLCKDDLPENCLLIPVEKHFSQILAQSQVIACAGGITMLEAIYYGKIPIVLPVPFQQEQTWTAKRLADLGMVKVITASVKAQTFAQMVFENALEKPVSSFLLSNGLDRLENLIKEHLSWQH